MVEKAIIDLLRKPGLWPWWGLPLRSVVVVEPGFIDDLPPRVMEAPRFWAYLVAWPTVLAEMPAAPCENLLILRARSWAAGVKDMGLLRGLVFWVKESAPVVSMLLS